jgi:folate-binding protein YgfZ
MTLLLDLPLAVEVIGSDAAKILHNLTTNQIQLIQIGESLETFVTDVRGWTVAHGLVFRAEQNRWLLLGQHPNPAAVCSHIDRYIIREKALVKDLSGSTRIELSSTPENGAADSLQPAIAEVAGGLETLTVKFIALGPQAILQVQFHELPSTSDTPLRPSTAWEQLRIAHFWPRMGVDIWEKCIPQEIDRDEQAISFTKGCYLGQETIARLDARGQIQKKLCLLKIDGVVSPGDKLLLNDQEVGHITSVVPVNDFSLALSVIRRGHFAVDTRLTCRGLAAQVIDTNKACDLLSKQS